MIKKRTSSFCCLLVMKFDQLPSVGTWCWTCFAVSRGGMPRSSINCFGEARSSVGKGALDGLLVEDEIDTLSIGATSSSTFPGAKKSTVRRRQGRKERKVMLADMGVAHKIEAATGNLVDPTPTVWLE